MTEYRPTILQYGIVFIVIAVLAFAFSGLFITNNLDRLSEDIDIKYQDQAKRDLSRYLDQLEGDIRRFAIYISRQQETLRQFHDAGNYRHWRDNRIDDRAFSIAGTTRIELYNALKVGLATTPLQGFPGHIDKLPDLSITHDSGYPEIQYLFPVSDDVKVVSGYGVLRVNLYENLDSHDLADAIDRTILDLEARKDGLTVLSSLAQDAVFILKPESDIVLLKDLVKESFYAVALLVFVLLLLFLVLNSYIISYPIRRLVRYVDSFKQTDNGQQHTGKPPEFYVRELQHVAGSISEFYRELVSTHNNLDEKNRELWTQAHHDPLTGACNRRAYDNDWRHIETVVSGRRIEVSLMLFDCDHFKAINDTYGHKVGDQVLIGLTRDIQDVLRQGDKLYRLGGDEFAAILLEANTVNAENVACRCLNKFASHDIRNLGLKEPFSVSIGIASSSGVDIDNLHELHHRADTAMYQAKRSGSHQISVYNTGELDDASQAS